MITARRKEIQELVNRLALLKVSRSGVTAVVGFLECSGRYLSGGRWNDSRYNRHTILVLLTLHSLWRL